MVKDVSLFSESISSGSYKDYNDTPSELAESGYTPIGIVGISTGGTSRQNLIISRFYYNPETGKIVLSVRNNNSAANTYTVGVRVLYVKDFS